MTEDAMQAYANRFFIEDLKLQCFPQLFEMHLVCNCNMDPLLHYTVAIVADVTTTVYMVTWTKTENLFI